MTITGTIIKIGEVQQITDKFKKRELVINTGGEYPQYIPIEFTQDKINLLNNLSNGQVVSVNFELRGREWNGKYFANVQGWKIETMEVSKPSRQEVNKDIIDNAHELSDPQDDLPF